jgi:DNA-binding winged helix-turn-helix (wHTH) protein
MSATLREADAVRFGPFRLDVVNRLLSRDGVELSVPPRAMGVLWVLVTNAGRVVSKQHLLEEVWRDAYVSDTSLAEAVSLVRQVLGDEPQQPTYIQTVPRRGYRFVAPVTDEHQRIEASLPQPVASRSLREEPLWTPWLLPLVCLVAGVAVGLIVMARARPPAPPPRGVVRFALDLPAGTHVDRTGRSLVVSRDGAAVAFVARRGDAPGQLFVRRLDRDEAIRVSESDGASAPFFSPDGRSVGFFAHGRLFKTVIAGGAPTVLADAPSPLGATWTDAGEIVFSDRVTGGLSVVSAEGGAARLLTTPDTVRGELRHAWPDAIPGTDWVLLTVAYGIDAGGGDAALLSTSTRVLRHLDADATDARALPTGYLLLMRPGATAIQPLDLRIQATTGPVLSLPASVVVDRRSGGAQASVAQTGVRVAITEPPDGTSAAWLGPSGGLTPVEYSLAGLDDLAITADGRRIAGVERRGRRCDLWVVDTGRGARTRVTTAARLASPVWSPDGTELAFAVSSGGPMRISIAGLDGAGSPRELKIGPAPALPSGWLPDGRGIIVSLAERNGFDVAQVQTSGEEALTSLVRGIGDQVGAVVSPDGRWLALESNESGEWTIVVRPFPGPGTTVPLNGFAGRHPTWAADSRSLTYWSDGHVMRVPIPLASAIARPAPIASGVRTIARGTTRDGRTLVVTSGAPEDVPRIVLEWFDDLAAIVRANQPMPRSFR